MSYKIKTKCTSCPFNPPESNMNVPLKSKPDPLWNFASTSSGNIAFLRGYFVTGIYSYQTYSNETILTECFWWGLFWNKQVKTPTFTYFSSRGHIFLPYFSASLHLTTSWSTQGGEWNNAEARGGWGRKWAEGWNGLWETPSRQTTYNQESCHYTCFSQEKPLIKIS